MSRIGRLLSKMAATTETDQLTLAIEQRNVAYAERDASRREFLELREHLYEGFVPDVFGHMMYLNPRDTAMALGSLNGQPIENFHGEMGFFRRMVRPGNRVLDIGANVGLYTLPLARFVGPSGRVYAFEPGPLSFPLLSANVRVNRYENVTLENAAVTERSGPVSLFVLEGESDNRIEGMLAVYDNRRKIEMRGVALDDYFGAGETVDFIKMDIQGAEFKALQGMEKLLTRSKDVQLVMEYAPASVSFDKEGVGPMLSYIQRLGFRLYDLPADGDETPVTVDQLMAKIPWGKMTNLLLRRF